MIYFSANEMAPARQIQLQKETCEECFQVRSAQIYGCARDMGLQKTSLPSGSFDSRDLIFSMIFYVSYMNIVSF